VLLDGLVRRLEIERVGVEGTTGHGLDPDPRALVLVVVGIAEREELLVVAADPASP
jgi:hypothetical protein